MLLKEKVITEKYGMMDDRLRDGINDITASFCSRTFKNIMPMTLEVLEQMTKKYEIEKDTICVSYGRQELLKGPVDLFKFLNEVIDLSMICPCQDVIKSTLGLINKILFAFQKEFKLMIADAEDMEMGVFCSMTNSSMKFFSALRSFEKRVINFGLINEDEVNMVDRL